MIVTLGVAAAPASAAPPCQNISAFVRGLDNGDPVATGRSTVAITISGQDEGPIPTWSPRPGARQRAGNAHGAGKVALA